MLFWFAVILTVFVYLGRCVIISVDLYGVSCALIGFVTGAFGGVYALVTFVLIRLRRLWFDCGYFVLICCCSVFCWLIIGWTLWLLLLCLFVCLVDYVVCVMPAWFCYNSVDWFFAFMICTIYLWIYLFYLYVWWLAWLLCCLLVIVFIGRICAGFIVCLGIDCLCLCCCLFVVFC